MLLNEMNEGETKSRVQPIRMVLFLLRSVRTVYPAVTGPFE